MTNLDSILKSTNIILLTKFIWSKLWFFQQLLMDVRIKTAEVRRIDAFEL